MLPSTIREFKICGEFKRTANNNKLGHVKVCALLKPSKVSVVLGCLPIIDKCKGVNPSWSPQILTSSIEIDVLINPHLTPNSTKYLVTSTNPY